MTSPSVRVRSAGGPQFPDLLANVRPILDDASTIRAGADCEVGKLKARYYRTIQRKADVGERHADLEIRIAKLEHEARDSRDVMRKLVAPVEADAERAVLAELAAAFDRVSVECSTLEGSIADAIARHALIRRSLVDGYLVTRSGGGRWLSVDEARKLAAESIGLVGSRTEADDVTRPGPRLIPTGAPLGNFTGLPPSHVLPPPAPRVPYDTTGEDLDD